jgi:hypothetical protein
MSPRIVLWAALAAALFVGPAARGDKVDPQQQPKKEDRAAEELRRLQRLLEQQQRQLQAQQAEFRDTLDRLQKVVKVSQEQAQAFQQQIDRLQQELGQAREKLAAAQAERDVTLQRVEQLMRRVRELEARLAKKEAGGQPPDRVRDPVAPNPPPANVKGKVIRIDPNDKSLVQISLGSDAGLVTGHTLEVYRLKPDPRYVGMVRIVEVSPKQAVARLVPAPARQVSIEVDDEVASRIERK